MDWRAVIVAGFIAAFIGELFQIANLFLEYRTKWFARHSSSIAQGRIARLVRYLVAFLLKWIPYAVLAMGVLATALGYASKAFRWGILGLFGYLENNAEPLGFGTVLIAGLVVWKEVLALRRRATAVERQPVVEVFRDDFSGDLGAKWDYAGNWATTAERTLLVGRSDRGGVTRAGAKWEDYTFSFEARLIKEDPQRKTALGVIVRAENPDNYYMLQIREDCVVPHRRAFPHPREWKRDWNRRSDLAVRHDCSIEGWFSAAVVVRCERVDFYMNGEQVFSEQHFLKIPKGRVGFRCATQSEKAEIRNVSVILHA